MNPKPQFISERWLAAQRIKKRWAFKFLFKNGLFARGEYLKMWVYEDKSGRFEGAGPKAGFIVSRRTDNRATVRNLWKRRMREVFRRNQKILKENRIILMEARKVKTPPAYRSLEVDMKRLFSKTGSLK